MLVSFALGREREVGEIVQLQQDWFRINPLCGKYYYSFYAVEVHQSANEAVLKDGISLKTFLI